MSIQRRKALITGSGRNLGRSIALRLAEAGCDVAIHARANAADAEDPAFDVQISAQVVEIPLDRLGKPREIAGVVAFLLCWRLPRQPHFFRRIQNA